jgi:DNA repair protein RecO (recombination protein O)
MASRNSLHTKAVVIKRSNSGERDRVVTLYTQHRGKVTTIAKGARSPKSSRLSILEPGNLIHVSLELAYSMPILTEARLEDDFAAIKQSLPKIKTLSQILEIVDRLSVEEENAQSFQYIHELLATLKTTTRAQLQNNVAQLVEILGFPHPNETAYQSVTEYVAALSDRPLRSYQYLTVKN